MQSRYTGQLLALLVRGYTGWSFNLVPSLYGMAVFYMQGLRLFNNYFEKRS